uniref:Uncharacterized protein n=1 Tax=Felis catus TaxID=9685 RepID=A0ABI7ZCJ4_FELCA
WPSEMSENLPARKNMKKPQEIKDSLTISQGKPRDSEIMQQKQKAANEKTSVQTREK